MSEEIFDFLKIASSAEHFYNIQKNTYTLHSLEKSCSYPDYEKSARFCMDMLKKCGFQQVERIAHAADGKTASCDLIMPEAWELCKRSFLEIVTPQVAEYDKILADTDINPAAANIWAAPTPEGGITAEVVDYDTLDEENPDVAGKIVLFTQNKYFGHIYTKLIKHGAAAIVLSKFTAEIDEPDAVYWFNGLGNFGWYRTAEDGKLPVFSISPIKARLLKELLAKEKVTLHGEMNTRLYEGEIYTVTGIIPGESSEEYALLAHMYEPFPGDDALGAALAAEIGSVLTASGKKPRKTLRAVLSMELFGFTAFLMSNDRYKNVAAALSLDGFTHRCSSDISLRLSPVSSPFFGDFFYKDNGMKLLPDAPWGEQAGNLSDDTFGGDSMTDIPTNWLYNKSGVYHHNTGTGFLPHWVLTRERFPMLADTVLQLISRKSFPDYTNEAIADYRKNIDAVLSNNELTAGEKAFRIKVFCQYNIDRLESVKKFADYEFDAQKLYALRDQTIANLPEAEALSDTDKELSQLAVERFEAGCPSSLAKIPLPERRTFDSPASRLFFALCDGRRTVLEALLTTEAALNTRSTQQQHENLIEHLQYLEKYGYLKINCK
ncbi:MAG: hypothetical protein IKD10_13830 [Lentisphaeria bacterium]|nr:hypothetical protein [Lentisphaeria bacterium]